MKNSRLPNPTVSIWFPAGDLNRFENGVLVETRPYDKYSSFHKYAVVDWEDYVRLLRKYEKLMDDISLLGK